MRQAKLIFRLLSFLALFLITASPATAETKTLQVEKDAFANEAYPTRDSGSQQFLTISNEPINRFGYLEFQPADLPEQVQSVNRVLLRFYVYEQNYSEVAKIDIGPVKDNWEESGITWENRPQVYQEDTRSFEITLSTGWKEVDITEIFNQWLENKVKPTSIFIYPSGYLYGLSTGGFAFSFKSRQSAANPAELVLDYNLTVTPSLPATIYPVTVVEIEATITPTPEELSPTPSPEPSPIPEPTLTPEEPRQKITLLPGQIILAGTIVVLFTASGLIFALCALKRKKEN
ncbi:MAG TPA: DNRLRE domain-containing protein [Candidatus Bathyarchaeia archaeon]|nr:DNRLRE domain-containing protein [Candidatus Bathyarchaeia archaeon]